MVRIVVVVENSKLAHYTSDGYAQAMLAVIKDVNPDGIIFGHTALGKDLSPKLAAKLDSGLISDVTQNRRNRGKYIIYPSGLFWKSI